jgi:hypothetical protein
VQPVDGGMADRGLPEIVFAPAHPGLRPGQDADVVFEVRRLADGRRALPVFTTVSQLVAALGPEQPWVALPLRNVRQVMGSAGVPSVVVDPGAEPSAWRWQLSDIEALGRRD